MHAPLARSNFDPGRRVNVAFSREIPVGRLRGTASVFYSRQSGRPYSLLYSSDFNSDGRTTNDLLYVPKSADEVVFRNGTFDQFMAFINSEECYAAFVGRIAERNACRSPWINTIDAKLAIALPVKRVRADLTFDILNLANALDHTKGLLQYANFNDILVTQFAGLDAATGKPIYNIGSLVSPTFAKFVRDDLKSRWQGQLGLRLRF